MNNWQGRVILLIIIGTAGYLSLQYTTSHFKADRQIILLNTTRPDLYEFLNLDKQPAAALSKGSLNAYFNYFRLVTEAKPDNSEALLMLGYLYEITGDLPKAQTYLNKANHLDPTFFFTEYDLGLLLFEQGYYFQSAGILQLALTIPPKYTMNKMINSVIYRQFFSSLKDNNDIIAGLQQAYHDANVLLMESLAKQKELQGGNLVTPEVHAHIM